MKLALKIVAVCLIAMVLITAFSSYLLARREFQRVKEHQHAKATQVGDIIRESVDLAYNNEGQQGIIRAVKTQAVETGGLRYRWVWFDVSKSDSNHPSASMESFDNILNGELDSVVETHGQSKDLHTYYPIDVKDDETGKSRSGAIEVSGSLDSVEKESWRVVKTGLLAMMAMSLFCFVFVAWAGVRMIGHPLQRLTEQTTIIGDGVYDRPLQMATGDEFSQLATALNGMAGKIADQQTRIEHESAARAATTEQLRHADRLKTVGRLAAGIAHEIGTPLNVISGRAGLIRGGKLSETELVESAEAIQSESNRIAGIVRQLLDFARQNPSKKTTVDLRIVVDQTVDLLRTMANKNHVKLNTTYSTDSPFSVIADPSQIQQVLTNLIVNAIQAMQDGGNVAIELSFGDKNSDDSEPSATDSIRLSIRDDGPGIDHETVAQIFEPFFTTKEIGQGTGLGLSIAHGIIQDHGGSINVVSEPGTGTTFSILLPRNQ